MRAVAWGLGAVLLWAGCGKEGGKAPPEAGIPPVAVRAAPVERGTLTVTSEYSGELFGEAVDVAPRLSGILVEVTAQLGDRVERGQLLARLDDAELSHQQQEAKAASLAAAANARRAEATLRLAKTERARKAPLAEDQLISAQEMSELEARIASLEAEVAAAKAQTAQAQARVELLTSQRADTRLVAPFDGTIAERRLDPGAVVSPTTPVVRVVKAGPQRVRFRVPERALGTLKPGLPLKVRTAATGQTRFPGKVERIGGEISRVDRAVQVEGVLDSESPLLRPGMYATVELAEQQLKDALLVPAEAVLDRGDSQGVFVAVNDQAQWRPVKVLGRHEGTTAVEAVLQEGERVLTLGHEDLAAGSPVKVVPQPGSGPGGDGGAAGEGARPDGGSRG